MSLGGETNRKKHILFFAEKLYGGGVEKILQVILRNFDYEKYDVTLYSSLDEPLRVGFYPQHIRHYHYFSSTESGIFATIAAKICNKIKLLVYYHLPPEWFYRFFIRRTYDVGIAFIEGYATRILSGAPKSMKKLAWVHTDMESNHWTKVSWISAEEEKKAYRNSFGRIVCVSDVVKQKMVHLCGSDNNISVLHNPIEREVVRKRAQESIELPFAHKAHHAKIITMGSLINIKGYDRLLRVVKKLHNEAVGFELNILGEGPLKSELELFINQNSLSNSVHLLGYKENPYPYLQNSDLYVCSSYAEGYNTAITEALVLGKAVVSTECSGAKEQLGEHNEWGICTPNTEEGLYEGIKQMLSNDTLEYYTRQAQIRGQMFTLEESMTAIYKLIDE